MLRENRGAPCASCAHFATFARPVYKWFNVKLSRAGSLILNYLEAFGLMLNYLEVNGLTLNYLGNGLIIKPSDQGSASAWPLAAAPIGCATSILLI